MPNDLSFWEEAIAFMMSSGYFDQKFILLLKKLRDISLDNDTLKRYEKWSKKICNSNLPLLTIDLMYLCEVLKACRRINMVTSRVNEVGIEK